jgi:hypothetical protein
VLDKSGRCATRIRNWTVDERYFQWVWAISMNTGELRRAIHRYTYNDRWSSARIFGRVLAGYLEPNYGRRGRGWPPSAPAAARCARCERCAGLSAASAPAARAGMRRRKSRALEQE